MERWPFSLILYLFTISSSIDGTSYRFSSLTVLLSTSLREIFFSPFQKTFPNNMTHMHTHFFLSWKVNGRKLSSLKQWFHIYSSHHKRFNFFRRGEKKFLIILILRLWYWKNYQAWELWNLRPPTTLYGPARSCTASYGSTRL